MVFANTVLIFIVLFQAGI